MKIPELLVNVIKKLNPEIEEVVPCEFSLFKKYGPTFETKDIYVVHVTLKLHRGKTPNSTKEEYTEKMNTAVLYTYPDFPFINLLVDKIETSRDLSPFEIFQELFQVERKDMVNG